MLTYTHPYTDTDTINTNKLLKKTKKTPCPGEELEGEAFPTWVNTDLSHGIKMPVMETRSQNFIHREAQSETPE